MGPARKVNSNAKSRNQRDIMQPYLLLLSLSEKKEGVLLETCQS